MVKNVLGAVADLTKGKSLRGAPAASDDESPLAAEAASMEAEAPLQPVQQPAVPQQTTTQSPALGSAPQENSYLKGLDLTSAAEKSSAVVQAEPDTSKNALTSFTWDDSQQAPSTTQAPKEAKNSGNPLASWLGMVKPHVQAAPVAEAKPSNP